MLTVQFGLLSKPVDPNNIFSIANAMPNTVANITIFFFVLSYMRNVFMLYLDANNRCKVIIC